MLAAAAGGWIMLRALLWTSPQFLEPPQARAVPRVMPPMQAPMVPGLLAPSLPREQVFAQRRPHRAIPWDAAGSEETGDGAAPLAVQIWPPPAGAPVSGASSVGTMPTAAAHQMLWMAAMASLPLPDAMTARARDGGERGDTTVVVRGRRGAWHVGDLVGGRKGGLAGLPQSGGSRWSGDGWVLVRRDGDTSGGGSGFGPTYGGNQTGAVLRYRLGGEAHRLTAYLRAYGAMNGTGEKEAALGMSVRPLAGVPVVALAELRASRFADGTTHARPAASLVGELPPVALGKGVALETYAQGGYVGGEGATGFIDGQMRVDRLVTRLAGGELRAGAGAWGGAQQGAGRLDVGPTLRLGWAKDRVGARLSLDWRVRVEGHAAPSSGPALTLSAGF